MPAFALARRLRAGETVYGAWCMIGSPVVAETIAREGFAAVVLDAQHGLWDVSSLVAGAGAVNHAGAAPMVRVPLNDFALVSRALDFGAEAIIAPMINDADDAGRLAAAAKYPPRWRAKLGAYPRHAITRLQRAGRLPPGGEQRHSGIRHDRNRSGARQCRSHRGYTGYRCAIRGPLRPRDSAQQRQGAGRAGASRSSRQSTGSAPRRRKPARSPVSIAAMPRARWPWPSAAFASLLREMT